MDGGPWYPWALRRYGLRWLHITFGERNAIERLFYRAFKGKYGDELYSSTWFMQKREAGLKVIDYNIRRPIRFRIRLKTEIWD